MRYTSENRIDLNYSIATRQELRYRLLLHKLSLRAGQMNEAVRVVASVHSWRIGK